MKWILNLRLYAAIIILLCSFVYLENKNIQKPELSQTVPPDMVYVKGNNAIQSFYISTTEEPNINWQMYLDWLMRVYVDYTEVYKAALPLSNMHLTASRYNDPIIDNYASHPAYNYYPVVGVSWNQIQNYMAWKTDRLNEIILIKNKFAKIDPQQVNEAHFNTEAFLEKEYTLHWYKKPTNHDLYIQAYDSTNPKGFKTNLFMMNNGILIPQYRLPTEAEWDYASQIKNQDIPMKNKYSIYGQNYFLYSSKLYGKYVYPGYKLRERYYLNPHKGKPYPYTNTMNKGVQEWLMDMEGFEHKNGYGSLAIYENNGFKRKEKMDTNEMKDYLGRLHFIFTDYENSKPIYMTVDRRGTPYYQMQQIDNPFYKNEELYEKYKNKFYDDGKYRCWPNQYSRNQLLTEKYVRTSVKITPDYTPQSRKVESGNWKKPGTQTYLFKENEASELIGFRCVLPATSMPVNPKYKVRWD